MKRRILALVFFCASTVHVSAADIPTGAKTSTTAPRPTTAASQPATIPSTPSSLHSELMKIYMSGNWSTLKATLHDKAKEIAALAPNELADITIIQQAFAECRPEWFYLLGGGKKATLNVTLFGRKDLVVYDPQKSEGIGSDGFGKLNFNYAITEIDNPTLHGHGASLGDFADTNLKSLLGKGDATVEIEKLKHTPDNHAELCYYELRGLLAAIYYTTPTARRCAIWKGLVVYSDRAEGIDPFTANRAVAEFYMMEYLSHPENYPSIKLPEIQGEITEDVLAKAFIDTVTTYSWAFADDNAMRAAFKQFATTNGAKAFTSQVITLPNSLSMAMDSKADKPLADKRNVWLKQQYEKAVKAKSGK